MSDERKVTQEDIDNLYFALNKDASSGGYYINPDVEFTKSLCAGILTNQRRYGYWACTCRLASGNKNEDLDIICPCDYRDADILEWGACF
jgi:ferredoxin-thioredoxin reductase catalytic chain